MGISLSDLDLIDIGMVLDMFVENTNDQYYAAEQQREENERQATAEDIRNW